MIMNIDINSNRYFTIFITDLKEEKHTYDGWLNDLNYNLIDEIFNKYEIGEIYLDGKSNGFWAGKIIESYLKNNNFLYVIRQDPIVFDTYYFKIRRKKEN